MAENVEIIDDVDKYFEIQKNFENHNSFYPINNDDIYHYTSPEGLKGIIENNALWFTQADYLNDKSEGHYFIELFNKVSQEYKEKNGKSQLTDYLDSLTDFVGYGVSFENDIISVGKGDTFICCFSKDNDSLPMWNYYVKNNKMQGYNIRFFCCNLNDFQQYSKKIVEVVYDERKQSETILALIKELSNYYNAELLKDIEYAKNLFYVEMCKLKYVFKNPCFEYEHEVRILVTLPDSKKDKIKYRVGQNGEFIPYIEISLNFNDNILNTGINFSLIDSPQITIAPLMDAEKAKVSLKMFLEKNNINNFDIVKSKCPVRY